MPLELASAYSSRSVFVEREKKFPSKLPYLSHWSAKRWRARAASGGARYVTVMSRRTAKSAKKNPGRFSNSLSTAYHYITPHWTIEWREKLTSTLTIDVTFTYFSSIKSTLVVPLSSLPILLCVNLHVSQPTQHPIPIHTLFLIGDWWFVCPERLLWPEWTVPCYWCGRGTDTVRHYCLRDADRRLCAGLYKFKFGTLLSEQSPTLPEKLGAGFTERRTRWHISSEY